MGSGADDSSAGGGLAIAGNWPVQFGSSSDDTVRASGTDSEGNVYVGGYTDGSLDGNPNAAGRELFVSKYDSTGQVVWTRQVPGILNPYSFDMTVDANGDVYATGDSQGNFDGYTNVGDLDVFVIMFDRDGNKVWSTFIGSTSRDVSEAIALDGNGYLYIGGGTFGNFDGKIRTTSFDLLIVKYDLDGNKIWSLLE